MSKRKLTLILSFALLLALVTLPAAAQSFPDPGSGATATELVNTTADSANVTITYYNQSGTAVAGPSPTIAGNGSYRVTAAGSMLPDGFNGAGVVSSNKPLASVVVTEWTGSSAGDSYEMGLYSGVSAGASKICFPTLQKAAPYLVGAFSVQNTGTAAANINITYYKRDGTNEGTYSDTIPPGAQHSYDLRTPSAQVPNLANGWDGSAIVEVTNGQTVAGVGVVNYAGRSATYNAADCSGATGPTTLVVPSQYRVYSGSEASPNWILLSAINVQNLENQSANITLQYTPRDPSANSPLTVNYTIPANSAAGFNTRNGGSVAASTFTPLGGGWDGTVTITSNRSVAATIITQWFRGGGVEAGIYSAANAASSATKFFVPNFKRIVSGSSWSEYSALIIQNIGSATASVDITFYDRSGTQVLQLTGESIAAGAGKGYNSRNTAALAGLGSSFEGHAVVTSNQPLAVVLNGIVKVPGSGSGTTNGVPGM